MEGKTNSASGTFLLSQSIGGGKTHNLITLGLLAKYPKYRKQVMADFFKPGDLGAVAVVAFSGRKTSKPFGIWGEIAEQLNRKTAFNEFYSPLKPPDPNKWVELLRGEPVLILLDKLPPYFEAARAVAVGKTYLDRLTEIALANLLAAVNNNKLFRAYLVITNLPWNPTRVEQRKGRIHRIGQLRPEVLICNMRYRGSVEDRIHQLLSERMVNI